MKSIIKSKNLITPFAFNKLKIFFKIKENDSVIKLFCYSSYIKEIIIQKYMILKIQILEKMNLKIKFFFT